MINAASATGDNSIKESNLSVSYCKESVTLNFPGLQARNSHEEAQTSSLSAQKARFSIKAKIDTDNVHCGQIFLQTLRSFFCCSRLSSYISSSKSNCCEKSETLSKDESQIFSQKLQSFFCCSQISSYISSSRLNCCTKSETLSEDEKLLQLNPDAFLLQITHLPETEKVALLEEYKERYISYYNKNVPQDIEKVGLIEEYNARWISNYSDDASLDTEKMAHLEEYNAQDFPEHKQPGSVYQVNQRDVLHMAADGHCFFRSIMCASTSSDKYASCDKSMLFDAFFGKPDLSEKFDQCMKKAEEEMPALFPNAEKAVLEILRTTLSFMKCFPSMIYKLSSLPLDVFIIMFPRSAESAESAELAEECHRSLNILSDAVFTLLNVEFSSIPFYLENEHYDLYLN